MMWKKRKEKNIEKMIQRLYAGAELPINNTDPITKETLNLIIKNIAMEIVKAQSTANQAMY